MSFAKYYFDEAILTGHSVTTKVEGAIVDILNRGKTNMTRFEPVLKTVIDKVGLNGEAEHTGGRKDGVLNATYLKIMKELQPNVKYDQTPKTDFTVDSDRISLKLDKGWIFAHMLESSQACFYYALNQNKTVNDSLRKEINNLFDELKMFKPVMPKDVNKGSYVLKDNLVDKFTTFINLHKDDLTFSFMKAALTGEFKFEYDNFATANKLFVIKFKNKNLAADTALLDINNINLNKTLIHDLFNDDSYIRERMLKANIAFRVLKSGKLNLQVSHFLPLDPLLKEYADILQEGFFDKITELLKQGYDKVKDQLFKLKDFLFELLNKGIVFLMQLLGLNINIDMQNEIEF